MTGLVALTPRSTAILTLLVLAALAAAVVLVAREPERGGGIPAAGVDGAPVVRCDRFASPDGDDDSGSGSRRRPYRSPEGLLEALAPGETGCLRGGTYEVTRLTLDKPRVTLAAFGSEDVVVRGTVKVVPGGEGSVIQGMTLDGRGGASRIGPRIQADDVVLRNNEITNHHTAICVGVGRYFDDPAPEGVVIEGNRIHDCGRLPPTNHDHGIYLSEARDTLVRGNWIYGNADRGIQQYPDVQGSLITGNVIDGNGQGVNFSGDNSGNCSNDNVVEGNVISNATIRWNVSSGPQGAPCSGNVVRGNCVFASNPDPFYNAHGGVETPSRSFTASDNTVADPQLAAPGEGDLRLGSDSPCAEILE